MGHVTTGSKPPAIAPTAAPVSTGLVDGLAKNGPEGDAQVEESVRGRVSELCEAFPVYPGM